MTLRLLSSLITWVDNMNKYILDLTEHGLRHSGAWIKIKKWIVSCFLLPEIKRPDLTKLPKLPSKNVKYMQWRIDAYNEHQEKLLKEKDQSVWERSE